MSRLAQPVTINRHRGIVLPSVLWITILTIVVAVNYASAVRLNTRTADNIKTSTLARYDAISGIYIALDRLLSNTPGANTIYQLEINENTVDIEVRPESMKTNLNTAQVDEIRRTFIEAGVDAGMARTLAARVIDWRDHDHSSQAYGMEDADYFGKDKPYGAKDMKFEDLAELLLIADIDRRLFIRLPDYFTIYSPLARRIYTLTARTSDADGKKSYMTRAIVQVTRQRNRPYRVLKWQHHNG